MEKIKNWFKTINKFSKLAVIFTVFYWLIGRLIMSNAYEVYMSADWIPKFVYKNLSLSHILSIPTYLTAMTSILYNGGMLVAIIFGIIGVKETYKTQRKIKWWLLLLTIFNILVLVSSLVARIIYPQTF